MPLEKTPYPLRLPESYLSKAHESAEAAFAADDHLYVVRYGRDNPELLGCSLLFLGNRVGGEGILDKYKVRTARSYLYRAVAAWVDNDLDSARRWLANGEAAGGSEELKRFSVLLERTSFRIVVYHDEAMEAFPSYLEGLPGIEIIRAQYLTEKHKTSLKGTSPPAVDMVIADFYISPPFLPDLSAVDIEDWDAPVVAIPGDHEWRYEQFEKMMPKVDLLCCGCTSEIVEVARPFGRHAMVCCAFPLRPSFKMKGLAKRFAETASRSLDLLFTGGLTHDFYRDKRSRFLSLADALDKKFSVKMKEGFFAPEVYKTFLGKSRFTPVGTRYSGYWSGRNVEAVSMGVVNLVSEESCMPYVFSDIFACFQVCRNDHYAEDVAACLERYDAIIAEILPKAAKLEAEMCSLFPDDSRHKWACYLRRLLYVTHMNRETYFSERPAYAVNEPASVTASLWLRRGLLCSLEPLTHHSRSNEIIDEGLSHYPRSLPLHYARALLWENEGRYTEAAIAFHAIARGDYDLAADDLFPYPWDLLYGAFWVLDARVRGRCSGAVSPLAPEKSVWQSFALGHLANFALMEGSVVQVSPVTQEKLAGAVTLAKQAVDLFSNNDTAQRIYLRAAYRLYKCGLHEWGQEFLGSFEAVKGKDGRVLNDCGAMVYDVLMTGGRSEDAHDFSKRLVRFLDRTHIYRHLYFLYPEVLPLLTQYNLPHGALAKYHTM